MGAWMSEMSNHIRRDVVEVVRKMTSFELSEMAYFLGAVHCLPFPAPYGHQPLSPRGGEAC